MCVSVPMQHLLHIVYPNKVFTQDLLTVKEAKLAHTLDGSSVSWFKHKGLKLKRLIN
jgi:hypothetical protein